MKAFSEFGPALIRFIQRHPWSISLSLSSGLCFLQLASEIREGKLDAFDRAALLTVTGLRGKLDGPMLMLTRLGDSRVMTALALMVVTWLWFNKRRKEVAFVAVAAGGTGAIHTVLKIVFHRQRPDGALEYLIPIPSSFSFPSGHAMGSMGVLASFVIVLHVVGVSRIARLALTMVAACLIVGVGVSRAYFGVHYPSDVLGGQLAGAAWVSAVTGWFYPRLLPGESVNGSLRV